MRPGEALRKWSMVNGKRVTELDQACRHVMENDIPGDVVECGVWYGGCSIYMGLATDRNLWMYDTFSGLTEPGEYDTRPGGWSAEDIHNKWTDMRANDPKGGWNVAAYHQVSANVASAGIADKTTMVQGDVCNTLFHDKKPGLISILRLDLDLYEPTKIAMEQLYHLLSPGGILLIDDYDAWHGARKAVDEYLNLTDIGTYYEKPRRLT